MQVCSGGIICAESIATDEIIFTPQEGFFLLYPTAVPPGNRARRIGGSQDTHDYIGATAGLSYACSSWTYREANTVQFTGATTAGEYSDIRGAGIKQEDCNRDAGGYFAPWWGKHDVPHTGRDR